jgi:type IV secretory pathway TrbD component
MRFIRGLLWVVGLLVVVYFAQKDPDFHGVVDLAALAIALPWSWPNRKTTA